MTLAAMIKINGFDIRLKYGLEINAHNAAGYPDVRGEAFRAEGRDGQTPALFGLESRKLTLSGWMAGSSHSDLLTKIDTLKADLSGGHRGTRTFRLEFTDWTDRYFLARLSGPGAIKIVPEGPVYLAVRANVEISIELDDPLGHYKSRLMTANLPGSPIATPYSSFLTVAGSHIMRPRILIENTGATNLTAFRLINTAVRNRTKSVTVGTANVARVAGRWGDLKGAASFTTSPASTMNITALGNFNAGCFTIFMFVRLPGPGLPADPGYFFSTTGNTIRIYHYDQAEALFFDVNGTAIYVEDQNYYASDEWIGIAASYDGTTMKMLVYRTSTGQSYSAVGSGTVTYRGLPSGFYIGTNASAQAIGPKYIDEVRLYNYVLGGMMSSPSFGREVFELFEATAPLPIGRGVTARLSFDPRDGGASNGVGWANTDLSINQAVTQNQFLLLDCEAMTAKLLTADFASVVTDVTGSVVSGSEFPFFLPGINGLQITYTAGASALKVAIEDARRFA